MSALARGRARPRIAPEEFRLIRDLINEHSGLAFDEGAAFLFDRRLSDRLAELELGSFGEYYRYLRFGVSGKAELLRAIERVSTCETYFMRQEYQLRAFRNQLLPRLAEERRAQRRLVLWSAGCSTGEEVYTIAIIVHEVGLFAGWDVRVVGSDLSASNIAVARRGVYGASAFRATDAGFRERYFSETPDGAEVRESIRRYCFFGQLNLLDGARAATVGRIDAVFCRNVLIYFDAASRRRVIDTFYERLLPGGFLMLGHSESLLNVSTAFELVQLDEDLVYRKPPAPPLSRRSRP